jgi:hypothetical protein
MWEVMDRIYLTQCRAVVNAVANFRAPYEAVSCPAERLLFGNKGLCSVFLNLNGTDCFGVIIHLLYCLVWLFLIEVCNTSNVCTMVLWDLGLQWW